MDYSVEYKETEAEGYKKHAIFVDLDFVLQKLLLVWDLVNKEYDEDRDIGWKGCIFSLSEWCSLAGIPDSTININKCKIALRRCLVIPDGRLHHWVEDYFRLCAADLHSKEAVRGREKRKGGRRR